MMNNDLNDNYLNTSILVILIMIPVEKLSGKKKKTE